MPMLIGVLDAHDNPIGKYRTFLARYLLPDNSTPWMFQGAAWCKSCGSFEASEIFPSDQELRQEFENRFEWIRETSYIVGPAKRYVAEEMSGLASWLKVRETRESPARCLTCGSTQILNLDDAAYSEPYIGFSRRWRHRHPLTGEPISVYSNGHISTGQGIAYYTIEGIVIPRTCVYMLKLEL